MRVLLERRLLVLAIINPEKRNSTETFPMPLMLCSLPLGSPPDIQRPPKPMHKSIQSELEVDLKIKGSHKV
jgi:hypothetical protein